MASRFNGPFSLHQLNGLRHFGVSGNLVHTPLRVRAIGIDGKPPVDASGNPLPLTIRWKQQDGPAPCEILKGGVTLTDDAGRASALVRIGQAPGAYRIRASIAEIQSCADALFSVCTEGVVSRLMPMPAEPGTVGEQCRLVVMAWDWRGHAVTDAELVALGKSIDGTDRPIRGKKSGGAYQFSFRSRRAGKLEYVILDRSTGARCEASISFLPGPAESLQFQPIPNPRSEAPFNQTRIDLKLADRYGNVLSGGRVSWKASAGVLTPTAPENGASSAMLLSFGTERSMEVTARSGKLTARETIRIPDVNLRFLEPERFTAVGGRFRVGLEVFPPPRAGVIRGLRISLRQPRSASLESVRPPEPHGMLPAPEIEHAGNLLRLSWSDLELAWNECQECLCVADLCYQCSDDEEACFSVEDAFITTHHSPDETTELNPGVKQCRLQKWLSSKELCLNICIIAQNDALYEMALEKARQQVRHAQSLLDDNIGVCCPDIDIKPCYHRFSYDDYKAHNPNPTGAHGDGLPAGDPTVVNPQVNETDPTIDAIPLSAAAKWLLTQMRVKDCLTVFVVPELENFGEHLGGFTVSKTKFHQSVQGDAGPTIFLWDAASDPGALAHELGHALIDSPVDRSDHVRDPDRIMNDIPGGRAGTKFTAAECSHIFDHIGQYGGKCS